MSVTAAVTKLKNLRAALRTAKAQVGKGLTGTKAQRDAQKAAQQNAVKTAQDRIERQKEIVAKEKSKPEAPSGTTARDRNQDTANTASTKVKEKPVDAAKTVESKKKNKQLTKKNVSDRAEKQAARESDSPMIRNLQNEADIRTGGNRKKDFDPTQTKAEAGASAKRIGSDFTRQEQIGMQKSLDRQMGELEWYKKNQPDNNEQIAIVSREIAKLKKRGFLKVKDSYAPKKPAIEGATAAGAKPKPKAKPFTGSKRGAFNNAKDKGAKTFAFDGQTFDTATVAKQFADADKRAGLNRGGAVKRAMGSADFRKGGMVLSTVDNRRNR